jgi:hypothetical protein
MPRRPAWSAVNSGAMGASSGVTSGVEVSLHKASLERVRRYQPGSAQLGEMARSIV